MKQWVTAFVAISFFTFYKWNVPCEDRHFFENFCSQTSIGKSFFGGWILPPSEKNRNEVVSTKLGRWKPFISRKFLRGPSSFSSFGWEKAQGRWVLRSRLLFGRAERWKGWKGVPLEFFRSQEPRQIKCECWIQHITRFRRLMQICSVAVGWLVPGSCDLSSSCSSDLTCSLAWGPSITSPDSVAMEGGDVAWDKERETQVRNWTYSLHESYVAQRLTSPNSLYSRVPRLLTEVWEQRWLKALALRRLCHGQAWKAQRMVGFFWVL